jgi:hypothetical protein
MRPAGKKTISLCPICYKEIPAWVYQDGGRMWMRKSCPRHGASAGLVEKDARFHRWFTNLFRKAPRSFVSLTLPITLRPPSRGAPGRSDLPYGPDMPLGKLVQVARNFGGKFIELSGGEPTERQDLPQIIAAIKKLGKTVILQTDGAKLADARYLRTLKKAGLDQTILFFDSLKSAFYEKLMAGRKIHGRELLERKRRALDNLQREGISTILCSTVLAGLNDREFNALFLFALRHGPCVVQLRLRSRPCAGTGAGGSKGGYWLSELFERFSKQAHISARDLREKYLEGRLGRSVLFHFQGAIRKGRFVPQTDASATLKLQVKLVGWPTVENIDLMDLKTPMAYFSPRSRQLHRIFHGVLLDEMLREGRPGNKRR